MSNSPEDLAKFFKADHFAVVGASNDRSKYGNRVFLWYQSHNLPVTPINPKSPKIEDVDAVPSLSHLPNPTTTSVSIITPPAVTTGVIEEAAKLGIKSVWCQPGAESEEAIRVGKEKGVHVIHDACILVAGDRMAKLAGKL